MMFTEITTETMECIEVQMVPFTDKAKFTATETETFNKTVELLKIIQSRPRDYLRDKPRKSTVDQRKIMLQAKLKREMLTRTMVQFSEMMTKKSTSEMMIENLKTKKTIIKKVRKKENVNKI